MEQSTSQKTPSQTSQMVIPELMRTKETKNTNKYDVPGEQWGVQLKCSVYLTEEALKKAFGYCPSKIRIIVEAL